jgi:hypothetical protein
VTNILEESPHIQPSLIFFELHCAITLTFYFISNSNMPSFISVFGQPFKPLNLPPTDSFASQTVLITGANTGLGLETARHIVSLGASKVILGVRTLSKRLTAAADIESTTGRQNVVDVWEIDLECFSSVKKFVSQAKSLEGLDTAIMNAGLASLQWNVSPDGWERQLQVKVLSTVLLSLLLLPMLHEPKESFPFSKLHMVLLGSDIHEDAKFDERNAENSLQALNDKQLWENSTAGPTEICFQQATRLLYSRKAC